MSVDTDVAELEVALFTLVLVAVGTEAVVTVTTGGVADRWDAAPAVSVLMLWIAFARVDRVE